jgi:hypothetical protein
MVNLESAIIFNGSFESWKWLGFREFFAYFSQFQPPGIAINHDRIKHDWPVGGANGFLGISEVWKIHRPRWKPGNFLPPPAVT